MTNEYNFENAKSNPYAKMFNKAVTLSVGNCAYQTFEKEARRLRLPVSTVIRIALDDAAARIDPDYRPKPVKNGGIVTVTVPANAPAEHNVNLL